MIFYSPLLDDECLDITPGKLYPLCKEGSEPPVSPRWGELSIVDYSESHLGFKNDSDVWQCVLNTDLLVKTV